MTNKISLHKGKVEVDVLIFKEDKYYIAYIPSLNLTAHSTEEKKAIKHLDNAVHLFMKHWTSKGSLGEKLKKLGWKPEADKKYKPSVNDIQIPLSLLGKSYSTRPMKIPAYC